MNEKHIKSLVITVLAIITIVIWFMPFYNWDMLPYMGIALEYNGFNTAEIHKIIYQDIIPQLPEIKITELTLNDSFRISCQKSSDYFASTFIYHRTKPLYTCTIFLLYKMGFNLIIATRIPVIIGYIGILAVSFKWLKKIHLKNAKQYYFLLLLAIFPPLLKTSMFATSDTLSIFLTLLSLLLLHNKQFILLIFISILLILSRYDNLALVFLYIPYIIITNNSQIILKLKSPKTIIALSLIAILGMVLTYHTFKDLIIFYTSDYIVKLHLAILPILKSYFYTILLFSVLFFRFLYYKKTIFSHYLLILSLASASKFIIFPNFEERYFIALEVLFILSFIDIIEQLKYNHEANIRN